MFAREELDYLLEALDIEEPLGVFYSNRQPPGAGPLEGKKHNCMLKYARIARKKGQPGWVSREKPGCRGGAIYAGFAPPNEAVARFVSIGTDQAPGERYLPDTQSMWNFFKALEWQNAPAEFCVFKPLSQFAAEESPLVVIFFARGEQLTGLCQLAYYAFADHQAVAFPFGSGCANLLSWPLLYGRKGLNKAVVGGADPSCRPYMEIDELSFAVPPKAFQLMLEKAPGSFLAGQAWQKVRRKIAKSKKH